MARLTAQERFEAIIVQAGSSVPLADFAGIEEVELAPWMVDALREAEASARRMRQDIEQRLAGVERRCDQCAGPVAGRADRRFCSNACRQAHHRHPAV